MDDPDKLRLQYKIAVLRHQQYLMELALHQIHVIRRRRRRSQQMYWVRPWIGRRRQFGLHDQVLVELRNEDRETFKNFMWMLPPLPEMFYELLTRLGLRISKQNTNYNGEAVEPRVIDSCHHCAVSCFRDPKSDHCFPYIFPQFFVALMHIQWQVVNTTLTSL